MSEIPESELAQASEPKMSLYEKYTKHRYHNDAEYRQKRIEAHREYYATVVAPNRTEEERAKAREMTKKLYQNNEAYRERQKRQALERYYRLKAAANEPKRPVGRPRKQNVGESPVAQ